MARQLITVLYVLLSIARLNVILIVLKPGPVFSSNIHSAAASQVLWSSGGEEPVLEKSALSDGSNAIHPDYHTASSRRANAVLYMLAINSDIDGAVRSVRGLEDRFNRKFGYPWVVLSQETLSEKFRTRIGNVVSSQVTFGQIPEEDWFQPDWIDEERAKAARKKMVSENVLYGGSVAYRNKCRYNSGFFYHHPLIQQYKWYWRIEPNMEFYCDVDFDPFLLLEKQNKTYGFTMALYEHQPTIPTLWSTVKTFVQANSNYIAESNSMGFISKDDGESFNLCRFQSSFEIADMDFWRGEAYTKYFEHLDSTGGFYYERWCDAPVHSIAVSLFQNKDKLHFFDEIGYGHRPYTHCPKGEGAWARGMCACDIERSFDYDLYSCLRDWESLPKMTPSAS